MLQHFNSKLINIMMAEKENSEFLTKERYDNLIIKMNNSKNKSSEKKERLKRHEVMKIENVQKLIFLVNKHISNIRFYVYFEELFAIIHEAQLSISHGGTMLKNFLTA